ncbi:MAG: hypothetical protein M3386_05860 [Actinomycetota bacterium]|nr:hypothetical protein [Actinomycetota bacterium]
MPRAHALLARLFDYAGVFAPASLPLEQAIARYAGYRAGSDAWMLGRFIVPAAQLDAFSAAARPHLPRGAVAKCWRLSVLGGADPQTDVAQVSSFNRRHADSSDGAAIVDTVELKVTSVDDVRAARVWASRGFEVFCECPVGDAMEGLLDAVARFGLHAKLRAGGTTADTVPSAAAVAQFLSASMARGIVSKATAGLHHALTGAYPLTDACDSVRTPMFGYLNLVLAAGIAEGAGRAAVQSGDVIATVERLLSVTEPPRLAGHSVIDWHGAHGPIIEGPLEPFAVSGRALVRSIGSCSFDQPVAEARALGLVS